MAFRLENRIPPPVVALCAAGVMYVLPVIDFDLPWRRTIAAALAVLGAALDAAALAHFFRAKTTFNPLDPGAASALVTGGVYRFTRNPMYVGLTLLLLAWGVYLANLAALAVLPLFVLYIDRFQIAPEERALAARFGAGFEAYRARVRRWL